MTATWRTREELIHQLVTLHQQGLAKRAIARALGISRNTVKVLVAAHAGARDAGQPALVKRSARAPRASKIDAYAPRIRQLIAQYPDITAQRVFETLREDGFTGGYTAVKKAVRVLRPPPRPEPSRATPEYGPGEMSENDWSPYKVVFADGHKEEIQAFSYVLVYSRRKYFDLYRHADLHALMDGHVRAFTRFGGCARDLHLRQPEGRRPALGRTAAHLQSALPRVHQPLRVPPARRTRGHPNDKPRVERSFWEVERSFLNGRSFRRLRGHARPARPVARHHRRSAPPPRSDTPSTASPRSASTSSRCRATPTTPPASSTASAASTASSTGRATRYAVPYDHVTDILPVRITQRELFVYAADLACIARHELAPRGEGSSSTPPGFTRAPGARAPSISISSASPSSRWASTPPRFFRLMSAGRAADLGTPGAPDPRCSASATPPSDLDAALGHAAAFGAFEHHAVERILAARATPRSLDEYVAEETVRRVAEALGAPAHLAPRPHRLRPPPRRHRALRRSARPRRPRRHSWRQTTRQRKRHRPTAQTSPSSDSDDTSTSSD